MLFTPVLFPSSSTTFYNQAYHIFLQGQDCKSKMPQLKRVCVIGAGPSGMSVLYHFNKLKTQGKEIPEIVCFDKQSDWGGLWKYSWETGE